MAKPCTCCRAVLRSPVSRLSEEKGPGGQWHLSESGRRGIWSVRTSGGAVWSPLPKGSPRAGLLGKFASEQQIGTTSASCAEAAEQPHRVSHQEGPQRPCGAAWGSGGSRAISPTLRVIPAVRGPWQLSGPAAAAGPPPCVKWVLRPVSNQLMGPPPCILWLLAEFPGQETTCISSNFSRSATGSGCYRV